MFEFTIIDIVTVNSRALEYYKMNQHTYKILSTKKKKNFNRDRGGKLDLSQI